MTFTPEDPRTLLGPWSFERVVRPRSGGAVVHVDGSLALVEETDGRLRWSEHGWMRRPEGDLEVFRVLFLVEGAEGWEVTFEDGRPFHAWRVGEWVEHQCSADLYRGRISNDSRQSGQEPDERAWSVEWDVTGPHKDYLMTTWLRVAPCARKRSGVVVTLSA